jgi:hypothetical protein
MAEQTWRFSVQETTNVTDLKISYFCIFLVFISNIYNLTNTLQCVKWDLHHNIYYTPKLQDVVVYRVYLKCLDELQAFPRPKQAKTFTSIYVRQHSVFAVQPNITSSLRFLSVGTHKTPSVFSSNWKRRNTSPTNFLCMPNPSQPPRDLRRGATVHNRACPCVCWFRRRTHFEDLLWIVTL